MVTYLYLEAKPGCEDQINEAYARHTGDPNTALVYSEQIILAEIAFIHSPEGERFAHMRRWLRTVDDWNEVRKTERLGTGKIKLSGYCVDETEQRERAIRDIEFILEHRMLFKRIDGLDHAREQGFTKFPFDIIENNVSRRRETPKQILFLELLRGRCEIYRRCVEHYRPDFWAAYVRFRDNPSEETWDELRRLEVFWHPENKSVQQLVEAFATQQDGKDHGVVGRFRDGRLPTMFQVRAALRVPGTRPFETAAW